MNPEIDKSKEDGKNQEKSILIFDYVKSRYILKRIFDVMNKKRALEIVKINKKIQEKLDFNINSYKKYCQLYSTIVIELNIAEHYYGTFINRFPQKSRYYHIYFGDSNEEIKTNTLINYKNIKKIKIIIDYQVKSFHELFAECRSISSIYFKKFFRTNITDMSGMFLECISLKEIDFSNFNTDNVKDMNGMFHKCTSLPKLNLSNFNTSNVTNMYGMFSGCSRLEELNLSNFDTNNVTNMSLMFHRCSSLKKLQISNFKTDNVKNMKGMFAECKSLKEVNVSNFNTKNVNNMSCMFYQCRLLQELDVSNFNTNFVTDMSYMFCECKSLKELNVSNFNIINNKTNINYMFQKCSDELIWKIEEQNERIII